MIGMKNANSEERRVHPATEHCDERNPIQCSLHLFKIERVATKQPKVKGKISQGYPGQQSRTGSEDTEQPDDFKQQPTDEQLANTNRLNLTVALHNSCI